MAEHFRESNDNTHCTVADYIATVVINRPPVNAIDSNLFEHLTRTFDELSDRDDVRVAILTAAGRCFCAGVDIRSRPNQNTAPAGTGWQHSRLARETFNAITECQVPVIVALNGPALGAGLAIAASCDILLASEEASLALPEINVGLLGGGRHAMRLFGHSKARHMMFTGKQVSGAELLELGVVEQCVPADQLLAAARELAAEIACKSPTAIKLAKQAMNAVELMSLRDGYRFEQNMTAQLSHSAEAAEARNAFFEKRTPDFGQ